MPPSRSDQPYAELHCRSAFSFLAGASQPERLVEVARGLGLDALALTDRDGLHAVVRFAEAARAASLPTVIGAELRCRGFGGAADEGEIVVLADGPAGYARLSRAISEANLAGTKGSPEMSLGMLSDHLRGRCVVLTGSEASPVVKALCREGPSAASRTLSGLVEAFGRDHVAVELWDHGDPLDAVRNDEMVRLAAHHDLACVATNNVLYATASEHRTATVFAALRRRASLAEAEPHLPAAATAYLRSGAEQERRFARYPGTVARAAEIAGRLAFDLSLVAPGLPPFPCPDGLDEMAFLRRLTQEGATARYGPRPASAGEDLSLRARAWRVIDHELDVIDTLGFAGYFLVVWDIVQFCARSDIFCQGRGSAANSAVCYALGITKADAVSLGLLFERFLSPERDGPPDIDIDIESGRREEVIRYVYERHGRDRAAQVANVIAYRGRSALRDAGRALGDGAHEHLVAEVAASLEGLPRHMGIHSGGMVICDRPVIEVCPVEWGGIAGRSVLQWDKDDCAAAGLVKFDLLGLGMLSALHAATDLIEAHRGRRLDLAGLPQDDDVYAMLCRADTVGVFQVESRAQMATLPRLKPRRFYDLVVGIALIRPGPIQGGSVHPYIRRRNGREPVTYLHPLLEKSLGKTLGVPLFQEQLMQMVIDIAGFTAAEADRLRQAMGSKRSSAKMALLRERLYAGMAERGITGATADEIHDKIVAFSGYGFPESHAVSFAYLVYASAWIKLHEPAAFCAALLNSQPMGFWHPHTLVRDARRHGVAVRTPDLCSSGADATLEECPESAGGLAVRLGLSSVRGIGPDLAAAIAAGSPYGSVEELGRRVPSLSRAQIEALAVAGAFEVSLGIGRREGLWRAGAHVPRADERLEGIVAMQTSPTLPGMEPIEVTVANLWATGISPEGHPTEHVRARLDGLGVRTADQLQSLPHGTRILVAGVVTHRQRPPTARGTTFINLEDETGLVNVVCSRACWERHAEAATAPAMLVRGRVESADGAVNVVAEALAALASVASAGSREYR